MKYDLFSVPILIDNIDTSKIIIHEEGNHLRFGSEIISSHGLENTVDKSCYDYISEIIFKNLKEVIFDSFNLKITNIWKNHYKIGDFQEKHIHNNSHFSFIIYDNIDSDTVFVHPAHYLINEKYGDNKIFETEYSIKNKIGKIIIFPSFLEHYVKKQKSPGITISGNLNIIGK